MTTDAPRFSGALRVVGWVLVAPGLGLVLLGAAYAADDLADRTEEYDGLGLLAGVVLAGTGLLVVVLGVLVAMVARHRHRVAGAITVVLGLATLWAGVHTRDQPVLLVVLVLAGAALAALGVTVAVQPVPGRGPGSRVHTLSR